MTIQRIDNYDELARARMLEQFNEECAPVLNQLLGILIQEVQEAEDSLIQLKDERNITDAIGAQLDILGEITGIKREGRDDNDYRDAINVQIQVNNTGGQEAPLTSLLGLLTTASVIDIAEVFPAGLDIYVNATDVSASTILLLRKAIAATVSLQFTQSTDTPFAMEGTSFGAGFGATNDPLIGGVFAFVTGV